MSYLALCRGNPATGIAIPGPWLKVLSTIVGGKSRDSGDGDQSPGQVYSSWEKRPKANEGTDVEEGPFFQMGNVGTWWGGASLGKQGPLLGLQPKPGIPTASLVSRSCAEA